MKRGHQRSVDLLDRQVLDADGEPVGIVDDLDLDGIAICDEISRGMPTPRVSGILTLIGRIPGGAVQLSELLGLDVVDATAQRVGTVVDVRLAAEGDLDDGPALQDCSAWWSARERD